MTNPPLIFLNKLKEYHLQNKSIHYLLQKYFEITNDISQHEYIQTHQDVFKDESFIEIWLFYIFLRMHKDADEDLEDTKAFLKYLKYNGIGRRKSWLYILLAFFEISNGDNDKALKLIEFGKEEKNQANPQYILDEALRILNTKENITENMYILMETCAAQSSIGNCSKESNIFKYTNRHFVNQSDAASQQIQNSQGKSNHYQGMGILPTLNEQIQNSIHYTSHLSQSTKSSQPSVYFQQVNNSTQNSLQNQLKARSSYPNYDSLPTQNQQLKQNQSRASSNQQQTTTLDYFQSNTGTENSSPNEKQSFSRKRKTFHDEGDFATRSTTLSMRLSNSSMRQDSELIKSPQSNMHSNSQFQTDDLQSTSNGHRFESQELYSTILSNAQSPNSKREQSRSSLVKGRSRNRNSQFDPASESLLDSISGKKIVSTNIASRQNQHVTFGSSDIYIQSNQNSLNQIVSHPNRTNFAQHHSSQQDIDALALSASENSNLIDERPRKRRKVTLPENNIIQTSQSNPKNLSINQNKTDKDKRLSGLPVNKITINGKEFTVIEEIGRGGSSRVYKVVGRDRKIFALKRVLLIGHDESTALGFKNEVELLKELQNEKYIVQLIDYEEKIDTQELLLLMECGDIDLGGLLRNRCNPDTYSGKRSQLLSMNSIRVYWEQMLLAVNAIHKHGIVHGDLKPANFLLVKGEIKLIDFGIAQKIQHEFTTNIIRDTQVGTLNYIPPEALKEVEVEGQGRSKFKLGMAADVWSLGCILYQMATGSPPFSLHKSAWKKIIAITSEEPPIDYSNVSNDSDLLEVLKCCLQRNPQKRLTISGLLNHSFLNPISRSAHAIETIQKMKELCTYFGLESSNITENRCKEMLNHIKIGGSFWGKINNFSDRENVKQFKNKSK